jgi:hypothetical protein
MENKLRVLEGRRTIGDQELGDMIWGMPIIPSNSPIPRRINFTPRWKNVPARMLERTFVGGRVCDACGKPWEQLGIQYTPCFTRCRRAFYCSSDCQTRHRPRHAPHCRRKRDFRPDDILKLDILTTQAELNGELVRAIKPQATEDRWGSMFLSSEKKISVPRQRLEFIRPPT